VSNFLNYYSFSTLSSFDADSLHTDPRFAQDSVQARQIRDLAAFARFVKMTSLQGQHWPKDSAQYHFVQQQDIRFVCVSANSELPNTLRPLVTEQYRDALSGERLYILRKAGPPNQKPLPGV
jgi:hypothetical protein